MSGDAHLSQEATAQANARYSLRGELSPSLQTPSTLTQPGSRFALFATLSTVSLACYNDTIFRADFDGDGL